MANDPRFITCPFCKRTVATKELARTEWIGEDQEPPLEIYSLLECSSCLRPVLLREYEWGTEQPDEDIDQLWPPPPRSINSAIPESLRREITEARICFDAKAYTAAVVMVRRTLEGVCSDHGVIKQTLHNALKVMAEKGTLDGRLLAWADELRVLGNEGAHFTGSVVSREDANDAIALAEAVLDYLYVLARQFENFKTRRSLNSSHSTGPQPSLPPSPRPE